MDEERARVIRLRIDREKIERRVRELALKGAVSFGPHTYDRLDERGITDIQMLRVLQRGDLRGEVTPGKNAGEWKCKMVDRVKGTREVGVATILIKNARLFIKTVEWEDPQ